MADKSTGVDDFITLIPKGIVVDELETCHELRRLGTYYVGRGLYHEIMNATIPILFTMHILYLVAHIADGWQCRYLQVFAFLKHALLIVCPFLPPKLNVGYTTRPTYSSVPFSFPPCPSPPP